MLKKLPAVFTGMLLAITAFAASVELAKDHPDTYTVRKGDTLWSISARFLQRPWQWPEIWQANPQVHNPHLIYPGDVLNLAYINGQPSIQLSSGGRSMEPAIDTVPLADIEDFLKKLRVLESVKDLPYVVGLEEDRLLTA